MKMDRTHLLDKKDIQPHEKGPGFLIVFNIILLMAYKCFKRSPIKEEEEKRKGKKIKGPAFFVLSQMWFKLLIYPRKFKFDQFWWGFLYFSKIDSGLPEFLSFS